MFCLAVEAEHFLAIQHVAHAQVDAARGLRLLPFSFPLRIRGSEITARHVVGGSRSLGISEFCE